MRKYRVNRILQIKSATDQLMLSAPPSRLALNAPATRGALPAPKVPLMLPAPATKSLLGRVGSKVFPAWGAIDMARYGYGMPEQVRMRDWDGLADSATNFGLGAAFAAPGVASIPKVRGMLNGRIAKLLGRGLTLSRATPAMLLMGAASGVTDRMDEVTNRHTGTYEQSQDLLNYGEGRNSVMQQFHDNYLRSNPQKIYQR